MPAARRVAILGGVRIPFCRNNTAYFDVGNLGLSIVAARRAGGEIRPAGPAAGRSGDGCGAQAFQSDWNLGREATLSSGLSPLTPGITLQRACGTSLDSRDHRRQQDRARARSTPASAAVPTPPRTCRSRSTRSCAARLLDANMARRPSATRSRRVQGLLVRANSSPNSPAWPSRAPARAWATTAKTWPRNGRSPREAQDQLAVRVAPESRRRLRARFLRRPGGAVPRRSSATTSCAPTPSLEKLATLKPAFDKTSGQGTLTAGNSTPLTDGASAALLSSEDWAHGARPGNARPIWSMRRSPRSISCTAKAC